MTVRKFTIIILAALLVHIASAQSAIAPIGATGGEHEIFGAEAQGIDTTFPIESEDSRNVGSERRLSAEADLVPANEFDGTGTDAGAGKANAPATRTSAQNPSGKQNQAVHHRRHVLLKVVIIVVAGAALLLGLAAAAK